MVRVRYVDTIRLLAAHDVEFIVVGMTAAILQGAPVTTLDVDIVHRRTPENVKRLLTVLEELTAYREDPRRLRPSGGHLLSPSHQLLETTYAYFDCLGAIDNGKSHDDLIGSTTEVKLSDTTAI